MSFIIMVDRTPKSTTNASAKDALHPSSVNRSSIPAASIVVWNTAPDGQVVTPMPSWSAYTGQTTEEIQGWGWIEAVHPDDRTRTATVWNYALEHQIVYETTYRLRGKDGIYREFLARGIPTIRPDGTICEWWGACTDLSERQQLEAERDKIQTALQESESRYRRLAESNIIGIVLWDLNGTIVDANDAFLNLVGYTYTEMKSGALNWRNMTPQKYEAIDQARTVELINTRRTGAFEKEYFHKNGAPIPVLVGAAMLDQESDRGIAFILDLTERRQAEDALKARTEELVRTTTILSQTTAFLEKTNQELDQFAYVVSHDLKAPLRAIANLSQWIEEDLDAVLTEETRHQMNLLRGRVHRMEGLIEGLLAYSRVGRIVETPETVAVESLLREIIDSLSPPPEFTIDIASDMPTIATDRLGLQQVFSNLISNAIKHHDRSDGRISIRCTERVDRYEFTVSDDGPGIEPQFHDRIFGIFQTLVARDRFESTGIGLSLVKKIVESKGGTIQVESQLGQGATFRFTWPK